MTIIGYILLGFMSILTFLFVIFDWIISIPLRPIAWIFRKITRRKK